MSFYVNIVENVSWALEKVYHSMAKLLITPPHVYITQMNKYLCMELALRRLSFDCKLKSFIAELVGNNNKVSNFFIDKNLRDNKTSAADAKFIFCDS